jgi:hypothetical protein
MPLCDDDPFGLTHESKSFQSDSELDSDLDDEEEAQYITLYPVVDQPLYKSLSPLKKKDPSIALYTGEPSIIDSSSSHSMPAEEDEFFQELRRMIPGGEDFQFDDSLVDAMDSRLLLTPQDVFNELCWVEILQNSSDQSMRSRRKCRYSRSTLDVPFDMAADDCLDITDAWYEVCVSVCVRCVCC